MLSFFARHGWYQSTSTSTITYPDLLEFLSPPSSLHGHVVMTCPTEAVYLQAEAEKKAVFRAPQVVFTLRRGPAKVE